MDDDWSLEDGVTTFSQLSAAIASNAEINVVGDVEFEGAITIGGKTNLKIGSSTGRVLRGGGYDAPEDGGLFHIKGGSDVTFSGLGFESGTANGKGGCLFVTGSHVEVEDSEFTECNAYVS